MVIAPDFEALDQTDELWVGLLLRAIAEGLRDARPAYDALMAISFVIAGFDVLFAADVARGQCFNFDVG
jgi:hypothetical protein